MLPHIALLQYCPSPSYAVAPESRKCAGYWMVWMEHVMSYGLKLLPLWSRRDQRWRWRVDRKEVFTCTVQSTSEQREESCLKLDHQVEDGLATIATWRYNVEMWWGLNGTGIRDTSLCIIWWMFWHTISNLLFWMVHLWCAASPSILLYCLKLIGITTYNVAMKCLPVYHWERNMF